MGLLSNMHFRVWSVLACFALSPALWASSHDGTVQDSVVVDGRPLTYIADIRIDSIASSTFPVRKDWWFGAGWVAPLDLLLVNADAFSVAQLAENRPEFVVEHHRTDAQTGRRWGAKLMYHQPWKFMADDVLEGTKGWVVDETAGSLSFLRQVALIPDSLAYERDTLAAPIGAGHGLRLGILWEGHDWHGVRPRVDVNVGLFRPNVWSLLSPPDPATWQMIDAQDTMREMGWMHARLSIDAGGVVDLRPPGNGARSASQIRMQVRWTPGVGSGFWISFAASPTRR
ncbi:MAG: hypothetical protein O3B70_02200 [Bacteroidetes bacterium]|nr:hypothetical protein [Bacteroidota bacterium]MDA0903122.1 hypothetical protein [Bacteroidota bacterium]MDA1242369.1 hypothetical protein [Bacteroidota bacterium]